MNTIIQKAWEEFLGPMLRRPKRLQVAALCHRGAGEDRRFLLVTSRESRRWIIPKGWPIRGLKSNEAALQEAWEEAGVKRGKVSAQPIGSYSYDKRTPTGLALPVHTLVYSVRVEELSDSYPEADERSRRWVSADEAADMVDETELQWLFHENADLAA